MASAAVNTLSALMAQAAVDQDVNCRVVGRCSFGGVIDRELHELLIVDPSLHDQPLTLDEDLGRHFLYVRYNAELTLNGLKELGLGDSGIDPDKVQKMDAVDNLDELQEIGAALATKVDLAHLGLFVRG